MAEHQPCSSKQPMMVIVILMIIIGIAREVTPLLGVPPPSNCTRTCGNIYVPYPLGLDDGSKDCYLFSDLWLTCDHTNNPPKLFKDKFEIIDLMLSSSEARVLVGVSYDCYNGIDRDGTDRRTLYSSLRDRVVLSRTKNVFTAIGCNTAARFAIGSNNYGGCMSGCNDMSSVVDGQGLHNPSKSVKNT